jgi:hypothetical protein
MHASIPALLAVVVLLSGCSGEEPPAPPSATEKEAAAARAREGLYGDQLRALDKARGIEQTLQDGADARREQGDGQ